MSTTDLVGLTLDGKYSIINEIGRGGMGAVYYVGRFKREAEASGSESGARGLNISKSIARVTGDRY